MAAPKRARALDDQFARLGVAAAPDPAPAPMPAEQAKPGKWDARISMTASADMKRALELARVNDGIEATARLRAMITLWQSDAKHRAKVDQLARSLR
jgi:hypothetical protein